MNNIDSLDSYDFSLQEEEYIRNSIKGDISKLGECIDTLAAYFEHKDFKLLLKEQDNNFQKQITKLEDQIEKFNIMRARLK